MKGACLEFVSGPREGEQVPLLECSGDGFSIGSGESADLRLDDGLVSSSHAAIRYGEAGEYWISDLASLNGTTVNGERLRSRERLLKDGDRICVGPVELDFFDGTVRHTARAFKRKVRVGVLMLVLAAAAWTCATSFGRSASEFRALAIKAAANGDFENALLLVEEAARSRNAEADLAQNEALAGEIRLWRDTSLAWDGVKGLLAAGKLMEARRILVPALRHRDGWTWNSSSARDDRREAEFAESAIALLIDATSDLKSAMAGDSGADRLKESMKGIDAFLDENGDAFSKTAYLAQTTNRLHLVKGRILRLEAAFARVEGAMKDFDPVRDDPAKAARTLLEMAEDGNLPSPVSRRAAVAAVILGRIAEARDFVLGEEALLSQMDFEALSAKAQELPLPSRGECAMYRSLSDARERLLERHAGILKCAATLAPAARGLEELVLPEGASPVDEAMDIKRWSLALKFDSLAREFPRVGRVSPCGEYDAVFGVESMYAALKALPAVDFPDAGVKIGFTPSCKVLESAFARMKTFMRIMSMDEMRGFETGRLAELCRRCRELEARKAELASWLSARAAEADGAGRAREAIVAGYYACRLGGAHRDGLIRISSSFRLLERRISSLKDDYDVESDPSRRIELKRLVLEEGLPGNPVVRVFWVEAEDG